MHIDIVPNRTSRPTVLLRESYREGSKVKKRTIANLSSLPMEKIEMIRQVLRGDVLFLIPVPQSDKFSSRVAVADMMKNISTDRLRHVQAPHSAMKHPGMENPVKSRTPRENLKSLMASRKSGFGSTLAAAYRRRAALDHTTRKQ